MGVRHVAIPRRGKPGAERQKLQRSRGFTKLVKWRTGSEARISHLKRDYGWARSRVDGIEATETWRGWGVLAHDATKIGGLLDDRPAAVAPQRAPSPRPDRNGTGPPGNRRRTTAA